MKTKTSKRLVIDASVAMAASGNSIFPKSKHCRDFLTAVLQTCHRVVMTPEIYEEWKKHHTMFSHTWRIQMIGRKLLKVYAVETNETLRAKIEHLEVKNNERQAMLKDMLLIEAALVTDKTVISLDEVVRALFKQATAQVGELRQIVWVNPDKVVEEPLLWLENGAMANKERLLFSQDNLEIWKIK